MALQQITYKTIVDSVKNYLTTNCQNVGNNYSTITNEWFKPMNEPNWTSVSRTGYAYLGQDPAYIWEYVQPYYKIWNTSSIVRYSPEDVQNKVSTYVQNMGINENSIIESVNALYDFLGNMISFVYNCTGYIVSPVSQITSYMIYYDNNDPLPTTSDKDEKIYADQINKMFSEVMDTEYRKNNYTYTNNMIKFGNFQCTMMGMFPSWITSEKQFP